MKMQIFKMLSQKLHKSLFMQNWLSKFNYIEQAKITL